MKTVAFIKSNDWMKDVKFPHGTHNGYVAVPPTNKYHGKRYDDVDVEVHGGLTFSEPATFREYTCGSGRKLKPEHVGKKIPILDGCEFISPNTKIGNDWWIFGFDTVHYGDNPHDCDKEYVIRETRLLQAQLEKQITKTK